MRTKKIKTESNSDAVKEFSQLLSDNVEVDGMNENNENSNLVENVDNLVENVDNLVENVDNLVENVDNLVENVDNLVENVDVDNLVENVVLNTVIVEKKKRGRKKLIKPDAIIIDSQKNENVENHKIETGVSEEYSKNTDESMGKNTGKKERKQHKLKVPKIDKEQSCENIQEPSSPSSSSLTLTNVVVHKKRGRKPRGGKIIHENQMQTNNSPEVPNIILHLKCVLSDLKKSNELNSNKVDAYSNDKKSGILCYNDHDQNNVFSSNVSNITSYDKCDKNNRNRNKEIVMKEEEEQTESLTNAMSCAPNQKYDPSSFSSKNVQHPTTTETSANMQFAFSDKELGDCDLECKNATNKEIWKKISQLKLNFHRNDSLGIQRSACFWDTCEFDTPPIHIPMSSTRGYGCFCHPECAVAFLMSENIDTSVKFERYYLLNSIYGPIYNYNKSIKPAANPHYLLNKFYGNLTINEYRKLFQCEQVVYMVNKPLTNVLPELYEDNNDFFIGNKIIQNNTIEIKKKVVKNAKSSILNEAFGIK
jgi:hypothetical protein